MDGFESTKITLIFPGLKSSTKVLLEQPVSLQGLQGTICTLCKGVIPAYDTTVFSGSFVQVIITLARFFNAALMLSIFNTRTPMTHTSKCVCKIGTNTQVVAFADQAYFHKRNLSSTACACERSSLSSSSSISISLISSSALAI